MISPLVHDFTYQTCVYDYLGVKDDGKIDKIVEVDNEGEGELILNEKDQMWEKFKNIHISEVFPLIEAEKHRLKKDSHKIKKIGKNNGEEDHNELIDAVQLLPEIQKRSKNLAIHIDLAKQVDEFIKGENDIV